MRAGLRRFRGLRSCGVRSRISTVGDAPLDLPIIGPGGNQAFRRFVVERHPASESVNADHDQGHPHHPARRSHHSGRHPGCTGTNFAIFSAHAERVELCLFDKNGKRETDRITLPEYTNEIWHGYLPGVLAGPALWLPRPRPL